MSEENTKIIMNAAEGVREVTVGVEENVDFAGALAFIIREIAPPIRLDENKLYRFSCMVEICCPLISERDYYSFCNISLVQVKDKENE